VPRPRAFRGLADAPTNVGAMGLGTGTGSGSGGAVSWGVHINMGEVATIAPSADASLPSSGFGVFIGLKSGRGHFFVAATEAST